MGQIEEARDILRQIGMPPRQQADVCCYTLLAMAGQLPTNSWRGVEPIWIRIHDIIYHSNQYYGATYAENSRETFRKQALHHFREAALVTDNGMPTNSPNYRYRLTDEFANLISTYGTPFWPAALSEWGRNHVALATLYANQRQMAMMPVRINGQQFQFSPGAHNQLQKAILEDFAPRFAPGCVCLYVGDSSNRDLYMDADMMGQLGFAMNQHDKMPDVILYCPDRGWLYFVEAVTSVGPMSPLRIRDIERMTQYVTAGRVYVTAFPNRTYYKRFVDELAWETEVWLASEPDHMIHLNGDRFMGPR